MRVGSRQNHAGNGYGQQVERRKTNWRDASNIHSFFFTRFPEEMNESDIWKKHGTKKISQNPSLTGVVSHSSVQLNINVEEKTWLRNTRVRRLKNLTLFDRMEDDFMWNGGEDITPKYIGDDMILLMGLRETRATPMAKEANEQGSSSLEKWTPQLRIGYRLV
ncbi:hypothetical protein D0Y65_046915 [Glycine soja]|uniref:Uncharacterized protein n=1 Tax=Glycine soja TaxID=3848 RepID=A0A445GBF1_GLYSO|nr:hypothetical protein D0Y65_046915 [Glycine soja]